MDSEGLFPDRSYLTALSENVTYPNIGQKRAEQRLQTSGSYHRYHNTQAEYQNHLHSHCHHSSTSRAFRRSLLGRLQVLSFIKHKYHVPVHFHLCIIQRGDGKVRLPLGFLSESPWLEQHIPAGGRSRVPRNSPISASQHSPIAPFHLPLPPKSLKHFISELQYSFHYGHDHTFLLNSSFKNHTIFEVAWKKAQLMYFH